MKSSKKIMSLVLSLALIFSTMIGTSAIAYADEAKDAKTVILYTSNIRGDIDAIAKVATVKATYESDNKEVILADTGNFLQGSIYASADRGNTVFKLMEKAGYDVVALGKYDFSFGNGQMGAKPHGTLVQYLTLSDLLNGKEDAKEASNIVAVSTNAAGSNDSFTFTGNMKSSTVVTTASGKKIGFVAVTDAAAADELLETSMEGITFSADMTAVDAAAAEMKDADAVFCLSNAGVVETNTTVFAAEGTEPSITAVELDGNCKVIETKSYNVADISASLKDDVEAIKAATAEKFPNVATSTVTLNGSQIAVRSEETNLGDFWTDALRWFAIEGGIENYFSDEYKENGHTGLEVAADKVVAIWNGGNLRSYMYAGDVIAQDVHAVLPYPNTVAVTYVTGEQLLEALEASLQYDAAFASVAGMEYNIDDTVDLDLGDAYEDSKYSKPNSIKKVSILSVNGNAFDPAETYAVITSNFINNGGDTYGVFKEKADNSTVTTRKVVDAVWSYVDTKLGGVIGSEYAEPQGRITIGHIHDYAETIAKATSKKDGSIERICSKCGDKEIDAIKKASKITLSKKAYTYSNSEKKPAVTVKDSAGKTIAKSNYTVAYKNNKKVGKATVTITFKGKKYEGEVTKTFKINPKGTTVTLKAAKKSFKVTIKKQAVQTTGYQIKYSTKSSMANAKTVTIAKNTTLSKTISKNIKRGQKYYVQVRTYKTIDKVKYVSDWSKAKSVTTKK